MDNNRDSHQFAYIEAMDSLWRGCNTGEFRARAGRYGLSFGPALRHCRLPDGPRRTHFGPPLKSPAALRGIQ